MTSFNLMILAAGYGRRMKYLTESKPKSLLKINNKELLSYNIDFFLNLGCKKIVINTHYLHKQINNFIKKYYADKNIELIYERTLLDTGGGIKNALSLLEDKKFLVTNADIFWNNNNINDVIEFVKSIDNVENNMLLLSKIDKIKGINKKFGDFSLKNNLLTRWKQNDPILFYSGLQILNSNVLKEYNDKIFSMNMIWDKLIKENKLQGEIMKSELCHIGDFKTFKNFNSFIS